MRRQENVMRHICLKSSIVEPALAVLTLFWGIVSLGSGHGEGRAEELHGGTGQ